MIDSLKPSEVVYSKEQLEEFLLPNLTMLREGYWPHDISEDAEVRSNRYLAPFVSAAEVAAEIDARLSKLPAKVREVIIAAYVFGYAVYEHANQTGQDETWLERERRWAMIYLSGRARKLVDYSQWKTIVKNNHKGNVEKYIKV